MKKSKEDYIGNVFILLGTANISWGISDFYERRYRG
jgi:hypothetical protein